MSVFSDFDFDSFCDSYFSGYILTTTDLLKSLGLEPESSSDALSDSLEPTWCGATHDQWVEFFEDVLSEDNFS